MIINLSKDLYPKSVILKSAYVFTDRAYVFIQQDDNNYVISITSKDHNNHIVEEEFKNELLSQAVRHEVYEQTKDIRKLIISRALASTILDNDNTVLEYEDNALDDEILKDWFESNENS